MNKREFIKKALDTTNGFINLTNSNAQAVNPSVWDYKLRDYEEKILIVAPLAEEFDFRMPGGDFSVFIDVAPSAASELVETTDITISNFSTRKTTFTPTERGVAYQLTRKEAVRAFFNVAEKMVKKLAYSLAQRKDALAVSCLQTYAKNTVVANDKTAATGTAASTLLSTDTLNLAAITKGIRTMENAYYMPSKLLTNFYGKQQLLNITQLSKANEFGTRDAIQKGLVGELYGLMVYVSHSIPATAGVTKSIILGESKTGEQAFGYAIKRDPIIEKEYHALGRYWDIVAHEEYDFQMLHPGAVVLVAHYSA